VAEEKIRIKVYRYDPTKDSEPSYKTYMVPKPKVGKITVLNALEYILENVDGTLSFYHSCDGKRCGGCVAMINGKAGLLCKEYAEHEVVVEPLKGFKVVKDLIVDLQKMAIKHTLKAEVEVPRV